MIPPEPPVAAPVSSGATTCGGSQGSGAPVAAAKVFQGMINRPPSPRRPLTAWPAHILRPPPPKSEGGNGIGPGRTEFELRGRLLNPQSAMLFVRV